MEDLKFDRSCGKMQETLYEGQLLKYISYSNLVYVAKPVDKSYQNLAIYEPVSYSDSHFDAKSAPILFLNRCGGYMSYQPGGKRRRPPMGPMEKDGDPKIGPAPGAEGKGRRSPEDLLYAALSKGLVVVIPGNRGRDCVSEDGKHFGKAPSMIVDLKAAVRYLRYNKDLIPGNTEKIISRGSSAGGGMSALLAISGNDEDYEPYLEEIGAARERDDVFAGICMSPVFDLEHQDCAYEWQYGKLPLNGFHNEVQPPVDQKLSTQLASKYEKYVRTLKMYGRNGYGQLTTDNYKHYYMKEFLIPSANKYLDGLDENTVREYLEDRPWITWDGENASFSFEDYEKYLGRLKKLPPFDSFKLGDSENTAFGTEDEEAAHYTLFSLRYDTKNPKANLSDLVLKQRDLLNPMTRLSMNKGKTAEHWWIRMGAKESGFACPIVVNFATIMENKFKDVDFRLIWDGGHCSEDDLDKQLDWIKEITK